jgi:tetratricopeptide (TPR) repeat protein
MLATLTPNEEAQLQQTIEMFEVITQSQPQDYQSLEILKEAYYKLGRQKDVVNTAKRIAQAYVQQGQLSSAILEYESILQLFPGDPDVQIALADIESRANSLSSPQAPAEAPAARRYEQPAAAIEVDDGRQTMFKIFVEGKLLPSQDFEGLWPAPRLHEKLSQPCEPFIQILAERGQIPLEQSLKLICVRSRLPYLPLERYDIDVETARSVSKDICRRWCVLPFDHLSKCILVATANPFNKQATVEIESSTKYRIQYYVTSPVDLIRALRKLHR